MARTSTQFFVSIFLQTLLASLIGFGVVKDWPAFVCFVLMWAAMFWAYAVSARQEDRDPNQFVDWLFAIAAVFAVLSVITRRPLIFGGWYMEPLSISNLPHHLLQLPLLLERIVGAIAYLGVVFAALRTLRVLERRPRFALLFILNPTVLLVLFGHNDVFVVFACFALSLWFLVKGNWWVSATFLGLAFGFGILGLAVLACFIKHLCARTAKEERSKQVGLVALAYVIASVLVMYPYGPQATLSIFSLPSSAGIGLMSVLLGLAILIAIFIIWQAEMSGKDTALFAILFVVSLLVIAGLAISITPFVLLLIPAIPFRSAPQLWLVFSIGLVALIPNMHSTDTLAIVTVVIFVILMILQSRHAMKETGIFTTIDVRA